MPMKKCQGWQMTVGDSGGLQGSAGDGRGKRGTVGEYQ